MRALRVLAAATGVVVALGSGVAAAPAAAAAPVCQPTITALPLPAGATGGVVAAGVPGIAVGRVTDANGVSHAMRWMYSHRQWVSRPIPGVAALGSDVTSFATGVNRHGAITVSTQRGYYTGSAYVASGGVLVPLLDTFGRTSAYAAGINDSGVVVGSAASAPNYIQTPARWDSWTAPARKLGFDAGWSSSANAVDDADDVLVTMNYGPHYGAYPVRVDGNGANYGFANGEPSVPGNPASTTATDLNPAGRTVGQSFLATGWRALVWDISTLTVLPHLAGTDSPGTAGAAAVSSNGTVVGYEVDLVAAVDRRVSHVLYWTDGGGSRSLLPASGSWTDAASAAAVDDMGTVYGWSAAVTGGPSRPTVWTCAAQQAFVPTATGVPAAAPRPDVVVEQG